jgi:hypothetical protein
VLADVLRLLDERGLAATFFCTHAGIEVPGHERALHPNFRRRGNSVLGNPEGAAVVAQDTEFYRYVARATQVFCPEAIGIRSHSLFFDSDLLPIYRELGLQYDSSCFLPLTRGLAPVWRGSGILLLPIYYLDHWDLQNEACDFSLEALELEEPGLKILDFHPVLLYVNAASRADYLASKECYHDPERLLEMRRRGPGARTLFLELLDFLAARALRVRTLSEINEEWRRDRDR